jgi:hypothetical protein
MGAIAAAEKTAPDTPIDLSWAIDSERGTAIVVDLPGAEGVALAMSLATIGYRPVPLYNACPEPAGERAIVDVRPIMFALAAATSSLESMTLPDDAPPAFLLDAERNPATVTPPASVVADQSGTLPPFLTKGPEDAVGSFSATFDNRSISLPTDFPSASFLQSRAIRRILLIQRGRREPAADLSHSLLRWQQAGLTIVAVDLSEPDPPGPITVKRPPAFRVLWYNLLAKLGLRASPLGGFGGFLPMPSSG